MSISGSILAGHGHIWLDPYLPVICFESHAEDALTGSTNGWGSTASNQPTKPEGFIGMSNPITNPIVNHQQRPSRPLEDLILIDEDRLYFPFIMTVNEFYSILDHLDENNLEVVDDWMDSLSWSSELQVIQIRSKTDD